MIGEMYQDTELTDSCFILTASISLCPEILMENKGNSLQSQLLYMNFADYMEKYL